MAAPTLYLRRFFLQACRYPCFPNNRKTLAALEARLRSELRANTFDPSRGRSPFLPCGAQAIGAVQDHYTALFGDAVEFDELRESYAMPRSVIPDADRREAFTSFIFWAS